MSNEKNKEASGLHGSSTGTTRQFDDVGSKENDGGSLDPPQSGGERDRTGGAGRSSGLNSTGAGTSARSSSGTSTAQRPTGFKRNTRTLDPTERRDPTTTPSQEAEKRLSIDIAGRSGHYIFAVGRPATGKSTMQSQILRYLFESQDYVIQIKAADESERGEQQRLDELLMKWRECWADDRFPDRTQANRPSEFRFEVRPSQRNIPLSTFGFFEVAGEDFKTLRRGLANKPYLLQSLTDFLKNPNCKFIFLLVCIGHDVQDDDTLFYDFLDYLRLNFGERYALESRVAIVISDPEEAGKLLAKRRRDLGRSGNLDKEAFVREFLPQTLGKLKGWKKDYGLAQFYIGNIQADQEGMEYIEGNSFDDAQALFGWVYENMTGLPPVPGDSIGTKIIKWLKQFG